MMSSHGTSSYNNSKDSGVKTFHVWYLVVTHFNLFTSGSAVSALSLLSASQVLETIYKSKCQITHEVLIGCSQL